MIYIIFITLALLIIMILVKNFTNKTNNTAIEFINKTNNVYTLNSAVIPNSSFTPSKFVQHNSSQTGPVKPILVTNTTVRNPKKKQAFRNVNGISSPHNTILIPYVNYNTGQVNVNAPKEKRAYSKGVTRGNTRSSDQILANSKAKLNSGIVAKEIINNRNAALKFRAINENTLSNNNISILYTGKENVNGGSNYNIGQRRSV